MGTTYPCGCDRPKFSGGYCYGMWSMRGCNYKKELDPQIAAKVPFREMDFSVCKED